MKLLAIAGIALTAIIATISAAAKATKDVWALGDCAAIPAATEANGKSVSPTAQAALQEGKAVANNILAVVAGSQDLSPFK